MENCAGWSSIQICLWDPEAFAPQIDCAKHVGAALSSILREDPQRFGRDKYRKLAALADMQITHLAYFHQLLWKWERAFRILPQMVRSIRLIAKWFPSMDVPRTKMSLSRMQTWAEFRCTGPVEFIVEALDSGVIDLLNEGPRSLVE